MQTVLKTKCVDAYGEVVKAHPQIYLVAVEYQKAIEKYPRYSGHSEIMESLRKQVEDLDKATNMENYQRQLAEIAVVAMRALLGQ